MIRICIAALAIPLAGCATHKLPPVAMSVDMPDVSDAYAAPAKPERPARPVVEAGKARVTESQVAWYIDALERFGSKLESAYDGCVGNLSIVSSSYEASRKANQPPK